MRREEDNQIYKLFDEFIEKFIIKKENFLVDTNEQIFTENNLNVCIECFVKKPNEKQDLSFNKKAEDQLKKATQEVKTLFSHAIWLWGFSVNESKKCEGSFVEIKKEKIPNQGFANSGMYHLVRKYEEVCFCLNLFKEILNKNINESKKIKEYIVGICLSCAYKNDYENYDSYKDLTIVQGYEEKRSMVNVLLYLSNPEKYERIISNAHKDKIADCFNSLLNEDKKKENLEKRIYSIRERLSSVIGNDFDFYDNELYKLWNPSEGDKLIDEYAGLKYKKSIILYGPPGTSKTYLAKQLAKTFVVRENLEKDKNLISQVVGVSNNGTKFDPFKYIRRLQLHENYGYENFIIGQSLENNNIETKPGNFKLLCDEAINDKDHPYVLILDEINRINLGRLFGEVFACIENRDETVELPYIDKNGNSYEITIPNNLHIIGTMNEIDFSLERVDFALRRRFYWYYCGYNKETLSRMLTNVSDWNDKEKFISRATDINKKIASIPELGQKYEIGHVIFSEINNILNLAESKKLYSKSGEACEPLKILWEISIKPLLESYLDNINSDRKKEIMGTIKNIYDR